MLIPRRLTAYLRKIGSFFPAISLTGPRQSGKTTLLREMYPDYTYLSLEDTDTRLRAKADPKAFLAEYADRVIFDEAQRLPELFSYLQGIIDADRRPGRFILSGSQNFLLRKNITQSLAGRVGVARLLPLDLTELRTADLDAASYEEAIFRGGYPARIDQAIDSDIFYGSYLATYVERDVNELISAANLDLFQRFLRSCAINATQTINLSKISRETGVSVPTVRSWIGILEQSYVVFRLQPYFGNLGKRLIKAPKLYFYDTGLLCYLLRIYAAKDINEHQKKGALFENLIVADAHKSFYHQGFDPDFYFYRDRKKQEVDLLQEKATLTLMYEIKSGDQFRSRYLEVMEKLAAGWNRPTETNLIYNGDEERFHGKSRLINWRSMNWNR